MLRRRPHLSLPSSRRSFRPRVEECEPRWAPAAGFEVTPTAGLVTSEGGTSATFTVRLTEQPTDDVVVHLHSSNADEGTPDLDTLIFGTGNWDVPQTVTVTGVNDLADDGDVAYQIVLDAALSNDVNYNGVDPADVDVVNQDDDTAGILITPLGGLVINEGAQRLFSVQLVTAPTDTVTLPIATFGKFAKEAIVKPAQLVFTPDNWSVPQIIRVTGKADAVQNEPQELVRFRVGAALSSDLVYAGKAAVASITVRDIGLRIFNGTYKGTFKTNPFTPISGVGLVSGQLQAKIGGGFVTISKPSPGTGSIKFINSVRGTLTFSLTVQGIKISGTGTIKVLANGTSSVSGTWTGGGGRGTWELARI